MAERKDDDGTGLTKPAQDDNLDDKGRDVNTGKVDDKHHPQAEIEQGGKREQRG